MSTTTSTTAEQLFQMPDDGLRRELIQGELRTMTPAGFEHGVVGMRISWRLAQHAEEHDSGYVTGAETGFVLSRDPDTVRAPDTGFVRRERVASGSMPKPFFDGAPDLAVEVVSPGDTVNELDEKVELWLAHGTMLVWVVNPKQRTVTVHSSDGTVRVLKEKDVLDAPDLLPGFRCAVHDIFGGP